MMKVTGNWWTKGMFRMALVTVMFRCRKRL